MGVIQLWVGRKAEGERGGYVQASELLTMQGAHCDPGIVNLCFSLGLEIQLALHRS